MAQTATITLLNGDYPDRLNDKWRAAQAAKDDESPQLLTDEHPYLVLQREYEALKAEAIEAGLQVTIEAVGRRAWRELKVKHPPRTEGDPDLVKADRVAGVDLSTVDDDLVYASLVEPKFTTRAAYDEWADSLSEGEFQTILRRAWELANIAQIDPKSLPALPTRSNGEN